MGFARPQPILHTKQTTRPAAQARLFGLLLLRSALSVEAAASKTQLVRWHRRHGTALLGRQSLLTGDALGIVQKAFAQLPVDVKPCQKTFDVSLHANGPAA